ncbi:MAG: hypothetical protein ACOH2H_06365 [Cypionkella sp.]
MDTTIPTAWVNEITRAATVLNFDIADPISGSVSSVNGEKSAQ